LFLKSAAKLDKIHNSNKNVGLKKLNSALIDIKILPGGNNIQPGSMSYNLPIHNSIQVLEVKKGVNPADGS
jgi:hypothetical protein